MCKGPQRRENGEVSFYRNDIDANTDCFVASRYRGSVVSLSRLHACAGVHKEERAKKRLGLVKMSTFIFTVDTPSVVGKQQNVPSTTVLKGEGTKVTLNRERQSDNRKERKASLLVTART